MFELKSIQKVSEWVERALKNREKNNNLDHNTASTSDESIKATAEIGEFVS